MPSALCDPSCSAQPPSYHTCQLSGDQHAPRMELQAPEGPTLFWGTLSPRPTASLVMHIPMGDISLKSNCFPGLHTIHFHCVRSVARDTQDDTGSPRAPLPQRVGAVNHTFRKQQRTQRPSEHPKPGRRIAVPSDFPTPAPFPGLTAHKVSVPLIPLFLYSKRFRELCSQSLNPRPNVAPRGLNLFSSTPEENKEKFVLFVFHKTYLRL